MIEINENSGIEARYAHAWEFASNPPLDCSNPHFKNRYASLAATLNEVRKACRMSDIVYIQQLVKEGEELVLKSCVMDAKGGRMELSTFPVTNVPNPQNFGSELTYKKRQQAQTDWGIVGEEDDDGEAAVAPLRGAQRPVKAKPAQTPSTSQNDRLSAVRGLYKKALAAGVKTEGIESWTIANLGTDLNGLGSLGDDGLNALAAYLGARIADMDALKGEAA